jgi:hypothetical protein
MRLKSRSLAFGAAGKGEARTAPLKGTEAETTESTSEPLARTQNKLFTLNPVNRRIRTRMYGGVGGESRETPPIPIWPSTCPANLARPIASARAVGPGQGAHGNRPARPLGAPELGSAAAGRIVKLVEEVEPNAEQVITLAGFARCYMSSGARPNRHANQIAPQVLRID